jgi:hypothetical protein
VLVCPRRGAGGVAIGQGLEDLVVLAGGFGVRARHPGPAVQGGPQQPHQREQQRAAGVLIDGEVELPVQLGVGGVVVGQGPHLVVQAAQPGQAGRVDLAGRQRRAERFQGRSDLEVLLDPAQLGRRDGETPVGVADQQALRFQPPHRLPDRGLADAEPLSQVPLAQLLPGGELTDDHQLADERGDQVGLADVTLGHHNGPPTARGPGPG